MKLIQYLEKIIDKKPNSVDLNSGVFNVNIVFDKRDPEDSSKIEKNKEISFTVGSDITVRQLSQIINNKSENVMTIPTYDPFFISSEPLYKIYHPTDVEFKVYYLPNDPQEKDKKNNYPYKVLITGYHPSVKQKFKDAMSKMKGYFVTN
jgi:hypothetical protein